MAAACTIQVTSLEKIGSHKPSTRTNSGKFLLPWVNQDYLDTSFRVVKFSDSPVAITTIFFLHFSSFFRCFDACCNALLIRRERNRSNNYKDIYASDYKEKQSILFMFADLIWKCNTFDFVRARVCMYVISEEFNIGSAFASN